MTLEYENLTITVWTLVSRAVLYPVDFAHPDEYDDHEEEISWEYEADDDEVSEKLYELLQDTDECKDMSEDELNDDLTEKYYSELLKHFEDQAREDAEENYEPPEPDYDDYY